MKNIIQIIVLLVGFFGYSQVTQIDNQNFEKTLIDLGIDSDGTVNGQVLTADIAQVTHLDLSTSNHLPIGDLFAGSYQQQLADFAALKVLNISGIGYWGGILDVEPSLDLSSLQNLEELYFTSTGSNYKNEFNVLFLSNNPNLKKVESQDVGYLRAIDLKGTDINTPNLTINLEGDNNDPNCCRDICVNVTSPTDAQNGQGLYSNWNVTYTNNSNHVINYSDSCNLSLNTKTSNISDVELYPNPVEDQLHLKSDINLEKASLYDITGKQIKNYSSNQLSQPIDMSNLHPGVYFICLSSDMGKQTTKKIIVE